MLHILRRSIRPLLAAVAAMAVVPVLADAILVAPHALFISHDEPTGDVYLLNQDDVAEEVTVELAYGYPATDSLGNIMIRFVDQPGPDDRAATPWLRAFPRRARVEPGERQRVRIQATPPDDLPDGEYWSRLIVTSRPVEEVAAAVDTTVQAGVTLELRTVTSVAYRKGAVSTGVRLADFQARQVGDTLEAWVEVVREGNAAFLGTLELELAPSEGDVVAEWSNPIAVYLDQRRRFAIPLTDVLPGDYQLRLRISTDRQDIDARYILPATPVARALGVTIGG
jgi:hypothetical protein